MTVETADPHRTTFYALPSLPDGYHLARRLHLGSSAAWWALNLASALPLVLGLALFGLIDVLLSGLYRPPAALSPVVPFTEENSLWLALSTLVLIIVMLAVHEACHGLVFRHFGATVRYGVNLRKMVAFAAADGYYFSRNAYLVASLAPLVIISAATVILMALTGGTVRLVIMLLGAANAGGAVGDLWFSAVCRRYPPDLLVHDYGDGAELYVREVAVKH
jgi:hypothetical protein